MPTTLASERAARPRLRVCASRPPIESTSRGVLKRFRILAEIAAVFVLGFTLTRACLFLWFADWRHLTAVDGLKVFVAGLRFDGLVALLGVQFQLWHFTWCRNRWLLTRPSRWL